MSRRTRAGTHQALWHEMPLARASIFASALCLLVFFSLLVPSSVHAAPPTQAQPPPAAPPARFDQLTTDDGLSQNTVTAILQDSQGFMWFGTENGLNRYDGYTFTVYQHDPDDPNSLRDDSIMTLYEDNDGVLWIGTQSGWLERYHPPGKNGQPVRFSHTEFGGPILSLYKDREGALWVGSWQALHRFDIDSGESTIELSDSTSATITVLSEDEDGTLWVGSYDGWLYSRNRDQDGFDPVPISIPIENHKVTALIPDGDGALWISRLGAGLSRLDLESGSFEHYRHDPEDAGSLASNSVTAIFQDHSGALWVGTQDNGLDRFDPQSRKFNHYKYLLGDDRSLSEDTILSISEDRSGVLWVGTLTGGVNKLDLVANNIYHLHHLSGSANSLSDDVVLAVHQDAQGMLWLGTRQGLDRYDRERDEWRHYRHDPDDPDSLGHNLVWTLFEDSDGTLWLGTQTSLDRYDPESDSFVHFARESAHTEIEAVHAIDETSDGSLWVAFQSGLFRFHPDSGQFQSIVGLEGSLSWQQTRQGYSRRVSVLDNQKGTVWIGAPGYGLLRLEGDELVLFEADDQDPTSLSSNLITAILEDQAGALWIGTGSGLDHFEPETETFAHYRVQNGLPSNDIRAIIEDPAPSSGVGPYLWISTLGGLARFHPGSGGFRTFDVTDGLQSDEFNAGAAYRSDSGELFFGGLNGLNSFYPENLAGNPYVPPVVITEMGLGGQILRSDLASGEKIDLSYKENSVSFEFAALDYHAPERNQYAYRMEGLDQDWTSAGSRRYAEYRDLRPGDYVFRVIGSNNASVWNEEGVSVRLTIEPPFWENWTFRALIALLIIALALGAILLRIRSAEARSRTLEQQVQERTAELHQQTDQRLRLEEALGKSEREKAIVDERNRLARELHDSVTQSLYAMNLYAETARRSLSKGEQEPTTATLGKLQRTAREALGETRLILFELRPPILEREGLPGALQARLETVEHRSGLGTEFKVEGEGQLPPEVEDGLYRIVLEALNNILRHAQARHVAVSLHFDNGTVELTVSDDGLGFAPDDALTDGGLGLRGMVERAQEIDAQVHLNSEPGKGSRVTILWGNDDTETTEE